MKLINYLNNKTSIGKKLTQIIISNKKIKNLSMKKIKKMIYISKK